MGVGWGAPSGAFYVAAWSDTDDSDLLRIAYGDGINWDPPIGLSGAARSVQVPAVALGKSGSTWYTVVAYLGGNSHLGDGPYACQGQFCGGSGRNLFVKRTSDFGASWSNAIYVDTSESGPSLASYGGGCFILAYVADDGTSRDRIRTKTSCDGGLTWGSTFTDDTEKSTDRPAIAWGSNGVTGGVVWTTNVTPGGSVTGNYLRTGRLVNTWGVFDVVPTADGVRLYTSNYPGLTVADAPAPQPGRYVRVYRRYPEGSGGREIRADWDDDLTTNDWAGAVILQTARSPASAAYSDWYNEFWTLYTR